MQSIQEESDSFASLSDAIAILRYEDREDLATLLADAHVDFEHVDIGFSMTTDAEFDMVTAAIHAPISACKALRELPQDDENTILNALREVWPTSEAGGMIIWSVSYVVDKDSLGTGLTHLHESPTGWKRVDRTMNRVRELLSIASNEDHFQEIGRLCRDGLISMAQAVFNSAKHPPLPDDNINVGTNDTKRMISRYVASECPGAQAKEIRKCVNSTVDLANKVTHMRSASFRDAALCAQATFNVIGLIAVISGKRGRDKTLP